MHEDIATLRREAHDKIINEVLTEEQRSQRDQMLTDRGAGPFGRTVFGQLPAVQRLTNVLNLTEEQQAEIETIRADLRAAVRARHEEARESFLALLTEEQLAVLDRMENAQQ
jgi:Spy/CpxP family protein refolding chaperone